MEHKTSNIFLVQPIPLDCDNSPVGKKKKDDHMIPHLNQYFPGAFQSENSKIQSNSPSDSNEGVDAQFTNCFYGLVALTIMIVSPFSVTLIPVHNVLKTPEYWYEMIFSTSSNILFTAWGVVMETDFVLNGCISPHHSC